MTRIFSALFVVLSLSLFGAGVASAVDSSPSAVLPSGPAQGKQDGDKGRKKQGKKKHKDGKKRGKKHGKKKNGRKKGQK